MNKYKIKVIILILFFLLIAGAFFGERLFAVRIHADNMISSTEELSQRITEELMKGNDSFVAYVNGMTDDQLIAINKNLDGFFGHVDSYTVFRRVNADISQVMFRLEVSDNYYVYQYIVNDKPIEDHVSAQVLAEKVSQVIQAYRTNSEYQTVLNYHDYIVQNTSYGFLTGEEEPLSYTAYGALLRGKAVCNGYAEAMELLLLCSNIDTYMAVGYTPDGSHAWNIVSIDDKWYHVDTTWDDPVDDLGNSSDGNGTHVYLNVNDEIMEKTHSWNQSAYPACVNMEDNYYVREQMSFASIGALNVYITSHYPGIHVYEIELANQTLSQSDLENIMRRIGSPSVHTITYESGVYSVYRIEFQ